MINRTFFRLVSVTSLLVSVHVSADVKARAVINAVEAAVLSSELATRVESLPVRPGERFAKGDLLVSLDCRLFKAQGRKVSVDVEAARLKRDNAKELKRLNSIGELDVALAQSAYEQSLSEHRMARLNIERCDIQAPWDGAVVELFVNAHESVRQQQKLIQVVASQRQEAEIVVPAGWLEWLEIGQVVRLQVDDRDLEVTAEVSAIIPLIDAVSQTVLLRAELPYNAMLIPGMSATAVFKKLRNEETLAD